MCKSWLIFLFLVITVIIATECAIDSAAFTLDFVNKAQNKLKLTKNSNIILVVGNTGCGKSTLIHYVAGDFRKLVSIEPPNPNSVDFEIEDAYDSQDENVVSATVSRTFIPEQFVDEEQNVWYDCPGFHDTRNETVEIAAAFLIRSVIESASNVKLVMVVDYDSITNGHSRTDFDELLSRTTQLLKRVDKFENSVSLVVSKVPSMKLRGYKAVEVHESNPKNTSIQFIRNHRSALLQRGSNEKKILLIDALLKNSNDDYPKISIFWRPNDVGPFSEMPKLTNGRHTIRKSILKNTVYTRTQMDDFGFPLSADALLHVKSMIGQAIDNISTKLHTITDQVQQEFHGMIESDESYRKMLDGLDIGRMRLQYPKKDERISLINLMDRIRGIIEGCNLWTIDIDQIAQVERDEHNLIELEFLSQTTTTVHNLKRHEIDYEFYLEEIHEYFNECEAEIQINITNEAERVIQNITTAITNIDTHLLAALTEKLELSKGFQSKLDLVLLGKSCIQSIGHATTVVQRMEQFATLIRTLNVTSINMAQFKHIEQLTVYLSELKLISKNVIVEPTIVWIDSSSKTTDYISTEFVWYSFLQHVYGFMSSYEVQRNVSAYNVDLLSNWGKSKEAQDLVITFDNFKEFIRLFTNLYEFTPTSSKLNDLNEIVNATLKSPISCRCDNEMLTIEGSFVRTSDIQLTMCPSIKTLRKIHMFAVDKLFIDSDLNFNGHEDLELHMLANVWTVVQTATFHLNGLSGEQQNTTNGHGMAGKPGNRGMNSGNFFGVANEVKIGEFLTIELIGGDGGNGQDGTGSQDIQVVQKIDAGKSGSSSMDYDYSPDDCWMSSIKFENAKYAKEFQGGNVTHINSTVSHLLKTTVNITMKVFAGHCCGATGSGGIGGASGTSGYYELIQTKNSTNDLPKIIQKDGIKGANGQNGRACKSTGLEVHVTGTYLGFDDDGYLLCKEETRTTEPIADPECIDKYVSITETSPNPPRELYMASSIVEYKRFLVEQMKNPTLFKIAQNIYNSIESNSRINRSFATDSCKANTCLRSEPIET